MDAIYQQLLLSRQQYFALKFKHYKNRMQDKR
jgi:hypothetical protein